MNNIRKHTHSHRRKQKKTAVVTAVMCFDLTLKRTCHNIFFVVIVTFYAYSWERFKPFKSCAKVQYIMLYVCVCECIPKIFHSSTNGISFVLSAIINVIRKWHETNGKQVDRLDKILKDMHTQTQTHTQWEESVLMTFSECNRI